MAFASRIIDSVPRQASVEQQGWSPRPGQVNPAVARMHERLRSTRAPGRSGAIPVPSVALRGGSFDPRAEALAAMDGGVAIEQSPVPPREHLAETASRFVRLRGASGKPYVFSRVEPRHVALYRNGVFATAGEGADRARVIEEIAPIVSNAVSGDAFYVHLPSDEAGRAAVLADLSSSI